MSERTGMATTADSSRDDRDLFHGGRTFGGSGMEPENNQPDEAWLRDSIGELWCCRISWCRTALGKVSRVVPASVYGWCVHRVDHRKIWSEEVAGNPGSFDACAERVERRINQEIGERFLALVLPAVFTVLVLFGLGLGLINLQKMEAYANVETAPKTPAVDDRSSSTNAHFALTNPTAKSW